MIDITNGQIKFDGKDFIIRPMNLRDAFLTSDLYRDVIDKEEGDFARYYLKPQRINGKHFVITIHFNQKGYPFLVNMSLTENEQVPSWENWSEADELRIKEEHDRWLEAHLGRPPYTYGWGEITSNYDPRSGSSQITIRYYCQA